MLKISDSTFRNSKAKLNGEPFNSGLIPIFTCVLKQFSHEAQGHNGGTGLAFSSFAEHERPHCLQKHLPAIVVR